MTGRDSHIPRSVLDGVDWHRYTVVLLKPDCLARGLVDEVLTWLGREVDIVARETVRVTDAQIFAHYSDIIADRDWFSVDVIAELRRIYVGNDVIVALGRGARPDTVPRVRDLLGHYDPSRAAPDTIRGRFGTGSLEQARGEGRLVDNLVHTSDEGSTARDFGIWFGANRVDLVAVDSEEAPA